ncbi:hypothetical protein AB0H86_34220 [Streptomyces sp. NPDC050997]
MIEATEFLDIPTTTLADLLGRERVMDIGQAFRHSSVAQPTS